MNEEKGSSVPCDVHEIDHRLILKLVRPRTRVLDLGCGDGRLLELLAREKGVTGVGIEIDQELVELGLNRGLSILQADMDEGLEDYPENSFDYVILCRSLHQATKPVLVLREAVKVGKEVILSFENLAYWRNRLEFLQKGEFQVDSFMDNKGTINSNLFLTVKKVDGLLEFFEFNVKKRIFLDRRPIHFLPNLRARNAIYLIN